MQNSSFFDTKFIDFNATFIIFDTKFIDFNAKFIICDTKFIDFNTKFIVFNDVRDEDLRPLVEAWVITCQ